MGRLTDEELVARLAAGDLDAGGELVRRYRPWLLTVARAVCRREADAEDAVQEACLKLLRKAHTYTPGGNVRGWLTGVARNAGVDLVRARAKREGRQEWVDAPVPGGGGDTFAAFLPGREPDPAAAVEQAAACAALRLAVAAVLATLTPACRETVRLHLIDGLSKARTAAAVGCPEATVGTRVWAFRNKVADYLARAGGRAAAG